MRVSAAMMRRGGLVSLGWDLEDLGKRYRRFVQRFERAIEALRGRCLSTNKHASFCARC